MSTFGSDNRLIRVVVFSVITCLPLWSIRASDWEAKLPMPIEDVYEPVYLYAPASNNGVLLTEPDGKTIRYFYRQYAQSGYTPLRYKTNDPWLYQDVSTDGGASWKLNQKFLKTGGNTDDTDVASINPHTGEIYFFYARDSRGRLIRTSKNRSDWTDDTAVPFIVKYDRGCLIWLQDKENTGFHRMVTAFKPLDQNGIVTWFSDDDAETWTGPSKLLSAPQNKSRYNDRGSSAQIVELKDGRLWMLVRTSEDFIWEYFSMDRGLTWSEGGPSRFAGTFSNVVLYRISNGRLVIAWLNNVPRSKLPPGAHFHKTARDAVHMAISDDDGQTWRGFREVVLGKRRHSLIFSPTRVDDAGSHHQKFTLTGNNKIVFFTGQDGRGVKWESDHRQAVMFDLDWLYETSRSTDFSNEYDDLSVFKLSKKDYRNTAYYSRVLGATLVAHPTKPYKKALHLGREKCDWIFNEQDGANWNFPIGKKGSLQTRVLLRKGFKGGAISLVDAFYAPSDNAGEKAAMFKLDIPADGQINETTKLVPDTWYDVRLEWTGTEDKDAHTCRVYIDGRLQSKQLSLNNTSRNGVCYARLRSTAEDQDLAGWLVESIKADVIWDE